MLSHQGLVREVWRDCDCSPDGCKLSLACLSPHKPPCLWHSIVSIDVRTCMLYPLLLLVRVKVETALLVHL